jgi:hypothetical protein
VFRVSLTELFLADAPQAYRRAFLSLAALVVVAVGVLLAVGCSHQDFAPWDASNLLEGGWRVFQGQRPHSDFFSPLGAVPLLLIAAGMGLHGPSAAALATGYVLAFPIVTLWAWLLARPRFPALPAFLLAALIGFLVPATRCLATSWSVASYAMEYNRLGWALLCLLLVPLFVPPIGPITRRREWLEGVSTGALFGLLLFTKINYVGMAALAIAIGGLLFGMSWRTGIGLVGGFLTIVIALLSYLRFDLPAMLADLRMVGAVQQTSQRIEALAEVLKFSAFGLALLFGVAYLLSLPLAGEEAAIPFPWKRWLLAALVMTGVGIVVCSTNAQRRDIPLCGVAALSLAEGYRRRLGAVGPAVAVQDGHRRYLWGSLLASVLAGLVLLADGASIVHSFAFDFFRSNDRKAAARIDAHSMRDLALPLQPGEQHDDDILEQIQQLPEDAFLTPNQYAAWVNDGLALARRHGGPESRVFCLDKINPFPFALGWPSARGDALFWQVGQVVDTQRHPPADRVFPEVTLVLEPKRSLHPEDTAFLRQIFGNTLDTEFVPLGESRMWRVYGRRAGSG